MPVFNGAETLDRALRSVLAQAMPGWEMIAIDDGSLDGSYDRLLAWAERDRRVRVLRMPANRGPAAARNEALRHAVAPLVAYLDCDDEYRPEYLDQVARVADRGDVLVFGYDLVRDDETGHGLPAGSWDSTLHQDALFTRNVATPLGIAHRRDLFARVGGFDESIRFEEDWDLWKRFARAGATFSYVPFKSGVYHIREGSLSRRRG